MNFLTNWCQRGGENCFSKRCHVGESKGAGRKSWEIFMVHFSNPIAIQGSRKVWQFGGAVITQGVLKEIAFVSILPKSCSHLMQFLRPLRSKDNWGWILRLRPWNFVIISESLAAYLEKVRQTFVWQTVPKFWFIWLWYLSFCITYKSKSLRNNKKDK